MQTCRFLISSDSGYKEHFDILMDCLIIYNLSTSLYFLAFERPGRGLYIFDLIVWVIFIIQLILNFFTEITDEKDKKIKNLRFIAKNYLSTWFFFDFVAIIPFHFFTTAEAEYLVRLVRTLKLGKALTVIDRLSRFMKISSLLSRSDNFERAKVTDLTVKYVWDLIRLMIILLFLAYYLACIFYWYSQKLRYEEDYTKTHFGERFGFDDMTPPERLERVWYFMMTTLTTVGYGDYTASNTYERIFLIVVLVAGVASFAVTMGKVNGIIAEFDSLTGDTDNMAGLDIWMSSLEDMHGKIPPKLKKQIYDHFNYYWAHDRLKGIALSYWTADDVEGMTSIQDTYLKNLPANLIQQVLNYLFEDIFYKFKYFFEDEDFKYDICLHFQPRKFEPGEYIFQPGDEVHELYLILEGLVGCGIKVDGEYENVMTFQGGRTILGDYQILTNTAMKIAVKNIGSEIVQALAIPSVPLLTILDNKYSHLKTSMIVQASKRMNMIKEVMSKHKAVEEKLNRNALREMGLIPSDSPSKEAFNTALFKTFPKLLKDQIDKQIQLSDDIEKQHNMSLKKFSHLKQVIEESQEERKKLLQAFVHKFEDLKKKISDAKDD